VELGLHIADFTWNGGAADLAPTLGRLARSAEESGIARLTVMDQAIDPSTTCDHVLGDLRRLRQIGFTVAYIFRSNPNPLATVDLLAEVVPEVSGW
jgi:hypothetical protein